MRALRDGSGAPDPSHSVGVNGSAAAPRDVSRPAIVRACAWCHGDINPTSRRDSLTCSQSCRQARHRFRVGVAPRATTDRPMQFAYADPPYPGLARRYYGCEEVDHVDLVKRLTQEYPDGWALSTSSRALRDVLPLCPEGARVAVWNRGPRRVKSRVPLVAWEPLIVVGGRLRRVAVAEDLCDVLTWSGRQHSHPGALVGMKPAAFCEWMFRLLGAAQGDTLVDLYPGSGAVTRAWLLHMSRRPRGRLLSRLQEAQSRRTWTEGPR